MLKTSQVLLTDSPSTVVLPTKPEVRDYAYVVRGTAYGCSGRQDLLNAVTTLGYQITYVWTPDSNEPVPPDQVDFLIEGLKKHIWKAARNTLLGGVGLFALGLGANLLMFGWTDWQLNLLIVAGVLVTVEGSWELYRIRSVNFADMETVRAEGRFGNAIESKSLSANSLGILAAIVIVLLAQLFGGERFSVEAAGLVKPAVRRGEVWRVATAILLHGNFLHFSMNASGLIALAKIVENTMIRSLVPIVFLLSGICGSLFSLVLYPNATSVGASGGILGLLGLVTIAVWSTPDVYPKKYLRRMIEAIADTALHGVVGFAFIDNAAHLGGLLGELGIGLLVFRSRIEFTERRLQWLSVACLVAIFAIAFVAVREILKL